MLHNSVLKQLNIEDKFDFTHSAETEDYGKPHPAVFLTVAKRLNVSPLECLVFEDSVTGIISAKAARMRVVAIPEKTHLPTPKLAIADAIYGSMEEFLKDQH